MFHFSSANVIQDIGVLEQTTHVLEADNHGMATDTLTLSDPTMSEANLEHSSHSQDMVDDVPGNSGNFSR